MNMKQTLSMLCVTFYCAAAHAGPIISGGTGVLLVSCQNRDGAAPVTVVISKTASDQLRASVTSDKLPDGESFFDVKKKMPMIGSEGPVRYLAPGFSLVLNVGLAPVGEKIVSELKISGEKSLSVDLLCEVMN